LRPFAARKPRSVSPFPLPLRTSQYPFGPRSPAPADSCTIATSSRESVCCGENHPPESYKFFPSTRLTENSDKMPTGAQQGDLLDFQVWEFSVVWFSSGSRVFAKEKHRFFSRIVIS